MESCSRQTADCAAQRLSECFEVTLRHTKRRKAGMTTEGKHAVQRQDE